MASTIFNKLSQGRHESRSAGTTVIDLKRGVNREGKKIKDVDSAENVLNALKELGIDISDHTRHQVTEEDLNGIDLIVTMADEETIPEFLKEKKLLYWKVKDPYEQSFEETQKIRDQISALVTDLVNKM